MLIVSHGTRGGFRLSKTLVCERWDGDMQGEQGLPDAEDGRVSEHFTPPTRGQTCHETSFFLWREACVSASSLSDLRF